MKKENKRMAQEKRAQKRAKAEKRNRITDALKIWGPICGGLLVLAIMIFAVAASGSNDSTDDLMADDDASSNQVSVDINENDVSAEPALNTTEGVIVKEGDSINLDYVGYLDGEPFDGGNTNGMGTTLLIGSGDYIDGFEDGIIGHAVGETFDLELTFPDDYWNVDMAGKEVVFTTTVNGIYE